MRAFECQLGAAVVQVCPTARQVGPNGLGRIFSGAGLRRRKAWFYQPTARRPADVYLPSFDGGHRTALDFACTSGIRCGFTFLSARDGSAATVSYEARKCKFLDTEALCKRENIVFTPCVCEASGGSWGPIARRVFATLANSAAKFTGDNPSRKLEEIIQTLSVILQRANALAILVRSPPSPPTQAGARTALVNAEIRRSAMDIDTDALQSV